MILLGSDDFCYGSDMDLMAIRCGFDGVPMAFRLFADGMAM